jgi:hypothetical protein
MNMVLCTIEEYKECLAESEHKESMKLPKVGNFFDFKNVEKN